MDELDRLLVSVKPPVDEVAMTRAWERTARLRRTQPRRRGSWRVTASGVVAAGLLGAAAAWGAVAAAANGLAPEPFSRALTRVGVLPEAIQEPVRENLDRATGSEEDLPGDGNERITVLSATSGVSRMWAELNDGSRVEMTASDDDTDGVQLESPTGEALQVFYGDVPAEGDVVAIVVVDDQGNEHAIAQAGTP